MTLLRPLGPPPGPPAVPDPAPAAGRPEHLRRRRRLLALSAPAVLLALLAATLLIGVTLGNLHARAALDRGDPLTAAQRYEGQQRFTPVLIEPWKAWFNAGTAYLAAGEHFAAVEQLRQAWDRVPAGTTDRDGRPDPGTAECRVRTNLSLALEAMGDDARAGADPGMAVAYYTEAMEVIGACTSDGRSPADGGQQQPPDDPGSPSGGTEQDATEQRQRGKAEGAERERAAEQQQRGGQDPGAEGQDGSGDVVPGPGQGDPRQRQLEERNREAERDRQEQEQRSGGGSGSGKNW
ncbi:hypothetical protein MF406_17735 [Georgenia sp. TF02-10]|uniref:hypothetical protein n=1 Tax=Georgenia sp. TF02-10 TaxID=2917725 RepID=UPI001FA7B450|nr:hypothetical protein [Georgenia sp. TF02-10]UNX54690.1 hypothetical protein MF406_17735 [Georgenia sp. TF02-10]